MATFTAHRAFDMSNVLDTGDFVAHSGTSTQHTYTDASGDYYVVTGTGLDFSDGEMVSTTITGLTNNMDGSDWWSISGSSFYDVEFTGYDDGYFYNNSIGTLFGMTAEVAWWLRGDDNISGSTANDVLRGYDGNDTVNGNGGNDVVTGQRGNDTVNGGAGNDTVSGGSGVNIVNGGSGVDTTKYDWSEFGVKVNLSLTTAQVVNTTNVVATDTLSNIENLIGTAYADTLTGSTLANTLSGGAGNDIINAGAGNDVLVGQAGKDTLTGGSGLDSFVFNTALNGSSNVDVIKDFLAADDTIRLENSIFKKLTVTGVLNAANFKASTSGNAVDANDFILYDTDSGGVYYDLDGNGAGAKVLFATIGVSTHPVITAADFVVI